MLDSTYARLNLGVYGIRTLPHRAFLMVHKGEWGREGGDLGGKQCPLPTKMHFWDGTYWNASDLYSMCVLPQITDHRLLRQFVADGMLDGVVSSRHVPRHIGGLTSV